MDSHDPMSIGIYFVMTGLMKVKLEEIYGEFP